jgi:hypothetical protein
MSDLHQFSEAKQESGRIPAILKLAAAIQDAFKALSRQRRKDAWDAINSPKGKAEIAGLMNNPDRSLSRFSLLKSFREWRGS